MLILVIRLVSALANFCLSEEPLAGGLKIRIRLRNKQKLSGKLSYNDRDRGQ